LASLSLRPRHCPRPRRCCPSRGRVSRKRRRSVSGSCPPQSVNGRRQRTGSFASTETRGSPRKFWGCTWPLHDEDVHLKRALAGQRGGQADVLTGESNTNGWVATSMSSSSLIPSPKEGT
jgi:hypothetical protein